ncbi:MAG TPA: H/ACA RNA-protein complex protein Gar1 [Methanosarcinales archaeon]|nr:H/ACA RNA-protein complex protein Gar1 [Methanosarcinales archaeon]
MKRLGKVIHVDNKGNLIVRRESTKEKEVSIKLNSVVMNKNKKKIGKIQDVFGPVKNPYISVRVFKSINNLYKLKNEKVYISGR